MLSPRLIATAHRARCWILLLVILGITSATAAQTQPVAIDSVTLQRLEALSLSVKEKRLERDSLASMVDNSGKDAFPEEKSRLEVLKREIEQLNSTFELIALGETDTELFRTDVDKDFDWQQEMVEIAKPVFESLRAITEKPRRISELVKAIDLNKERLLITNEAKQRVQSLLGQQSTDLAALQLENLLQDWQSTETSIEQQLLADETKLSILRNDDVSMFDGARRWFSEFVLGRGLTLVLAVVAGMLTWLFLRFCWWLYRTRFTNKKLRRKSTWYRLLSYSYFIAAAVLVWVAVVAVLYTRQDFLLLAMALLLTTILALSLRQAIPQYVKEARLLLNAGSVREDERVIYNGLPWQVNAINIESVFWNPAIEGVLRLPIESLSGLTSRPTSDDLWFPSKKGDYLILPDGTYAQVVLQTPELVQLSAKGGASLTYPTSEFYNMNIVNLSAFETFGVAVTFGLDYSLQEKSLTEIPQILQQACTAALHTAGYSEGTKSVFTGLNSAGASSLDFLIYGSFASSLAGNYYTLERIIQQACVAASNQHGWNIPYPQMTIHTNSAI